MNEFPIKSSLLLSLIEKVEIRSIKTILLTKNLIAYYKAWLKNSEKIDSIWDVYIKSLDEFEIAEKEYSKDLDTFMEQTKKWTNE